ncbi:unnamed protein product, partial [Prorocentrum cordatum]
MQIASPQRLSQRERLGLLIEFYVLLDDGSGVTCLVSITPDPRGLLGVFADWLTLRAWNEVAAIDIGSSVHESAVFEVAQRSYDSAYEAEETQVLLRSRIVVATCTSAVLHTALTKGKVGKMYRPVDFATVIVDEAAQASEPDVVLPSLLAGQRVVVIGDHKQLGPVVPERSLCRAYMCALETPFIERMLKGGGSRLPSSTLLNVQYRMHASIRRFPSQKFYGGKLQDEASTPALPPLRCLWPSEEERVVFVDCQTSHAFGYVMDDGRRSTMPPALVEGNTSLKNEGEVQLVVEALLRLIRDGRCSTSDIAIITPYRAQQMQIRDALAQVVGEDACGRGAAPRPGGQKADSAAGARTSADALVLRLSRELSEARSKYEARMEALGDEEVVQRLIAVAPALASLLRGRHPVPVDKGGAACEESRLADGSCVGDSKMDVKAEVNHCVEAQLLRPVATAAVDPSVDFLVALQFDGGQMAVTEADCCSKLGLTAMAVDVRSEQVFEKLERVGVEYLVIGELVYGITRSMSISSIVHDMLRQDLHSLGDRRNQLRDVRAPGTPVHQSAVTAPTNEALSSPREFNQPELGRALADWFAKAEVTKDMVIFNAVGPAKRHSFQIGLRARRTLGCIATRGGALVRLLIGDRADAPAGLQWSNAAVDRGFTEAKQQQINAELASNFADALTSIQHPYKPFHSPVMVNDVPVSNAGGIGFLVPHDKRERQLPPEQRPLVQFEDAIHGRAARLRVTDASLQFEVTILNIHICGL